MKKKISFAIVAALLSLALATSSGCGRMGGVVVRAMVATAVVATVLAAHDAHYHHHHCGHHFVIVEDREVYEYEGRWEYYDPYDGQWYAYDEPPY